ncbi:trypsin-like peptidase domain-containing protein [Cytobacillus sp. S13-E01]|uniref:S1C family serine protease n=1 Tax=Cytobacillus sp. S13-E01 TaxID=3031326 RepID=UPI0023D86F22|nr:trypsin-like peptidase domain-containing protein [Cytobacillus sp. S13-E01]MDF0728147.1 trypsin-like peptidase domain-containing protein [Cytobacillus sp. S13-E01]
MKNVKSSLIGAVIGTSITVFAIVPLFDSNESINRSTVETTTKSSSDITGLETVSYSISTEIVQAVDKVSDAVVGVSNIKADTGWTNSTNGGTGSGVIYKKQNGYAYIVTNQHVIADADSVEIVLRDGTKLSAEVLGSDELTDLAVLRIEDREGTKVAELGSSDNLRAGEPVIAIGNPLGTEFSGSVTQGIISGLERTIPIDLNNDGAQDWATEVIQTDAAINPGNSGGALVNINGQVIGINSMKISQQEVEGIGFAIPISYAKPIIEDLEVSGAVIRPFIGIASVSLTEVSLNQRQQSLQLPSEITDGIVVVNVSENSPALEAGLKEMDVIVALDGNEITSLVDLRKYLYETKVIGDTIEISFYRAGELQTTTLTLSTNE